MLRLRVGQGSAPNCHNRSDAVVRHVPSTGVAKPKKLAFVIAHLGPGGAQRVAANAANTLVDRGHEVHIILIHARELAYRLDPRIVVHGVLAASPEVDSKPLMRVQRKIPAIRQHLRGWLWLKSIIVFAATLVRPIRQAHILIGRVRSLRGRIKAVDADAILSFLTDTNILTILATRGLNTHTVISERNDPRLQRHRPRTELLRRLVYRHANVVTANSRGALSALEPFVPKEKLAFLPNPLVNTLSSDTVAFDDPTIITVGRLVEQKGIDVLLAAWSEATKLLGGWRLAVVGDGTLLGELQSLARDLGIAATVDWFGHVANPFPLLKGAKFFVMTSRFEGTPNALLEAMACGLPAVVSNASPGPVELVGSDEAAGLIVPVEDATATAQAIIRLAREESLRQRLAAAARERVREYDMDLAIEVWLKLLRCE